MADVPREKIRSQLLEVGFDDARQSELVGGLSGGWKMKLELARAMLYHADLLLLDEPTNHVRSHEFFWRITMLMIFSFFLQLDRASVKWLEKYLMAQKRVTCLIISHDSGYVSVLELGCTILTMIQAS